MPVEELTAAAVLVELIVAAWLVWRNHREVRFMRSLRPLMPADADLPLFDALARRASQITNIGAYLLVLTMASTVLAELGLPAIAEIFPPIRAINGALILVLLAGPTYVGREMRRMVDQHRKPQEGS